MEDSNVMVGEWIVYIDSIMRTKTSKTTQELLFVWFVSSVLHAFYLICLKYKNFGFYFILFWKKCRVHLNIEQLLILSFY